MSDTSESTGLTRRRALGLAGATLIGGAALPLLGRTAATAAPLTVSPPSPGPVGPFGPLAQGGNKALVLTFLDQVYNHGNVAFADVAVRSDLIQHDPTLANGRVALQRAALATRAANPAARLTFFQTLADGDLVLVHSQLTLQPGDLGQANFDIFRVQAGRIAEHWNAIQPVPSNPQNTNGMFATLSKPYDFGQPDPHASTAATRRLGTAYFTQAVVDKDLSAIDEYVADSYIQHDLYVASGAAASKAALTFYYAQFPQLADTVERVVVEGDYIAFHSHLTYTPSDPGQAVVDMFRALDGKIVEHWDVIQPVPATSVNTNTMF